jgi:ribosomal protein S1
MRELFGTWEENASMFSIGQTVAGVVRSIEDYGIFVELAPNLAGLAELRDDLAKNPLPGQCVAVYIKNIIPDRMKIKLVLVDVSGEESAPRQLKYFVDPKTLHISKWRYSPEFSNKNIETIFE